MHRRDCVLGLALLFIAGGADWPQFRGPLGTGVAEGSPRTTWTASDGVKWKTPLPGPGSSTPIIFGDHIYVTCYSGYGTTQGGNGSPESLKRHLLAINRKTGEIVWKAEVPGAAGEDPYRGFITEHGYASSSPVADADGVYVFFGKSGVLGFTHDGKKLWQTSVGTRSDVRGWGSCASPVLFENLVIVNAASEDRAIVALDKKTGKQVWKAPGNRLSLSFSTPAILTTGGRPELVVAMPGEVWGLDPRKGDLIWFTKINPDGNVCPAIVPGDGVAYITGGFQSKGSLAVKTGGDGELPKSSTLWTARNSSYVPTPVLADSKLHYVNEDGLAVCLNAQTGAVIYEERLKVPGLGGKSRPFYASPVLANGNLYIPSRKAGVFVLKAGDAFEQIHVNPPLDDSDFNASPAICGKQILLRSNKFLYSVE